MAKLDQVLAGRIKEETYEVDRDEGPFLHHGEMWAAAKRDYTKWKEEQSGPGRLWYYCVDRELVSDDPRIHIYTNTFVTDVGFEAIDAWQAGILMNPETCKPDIAWTNEHCSKQLEERSLGKTLIEFIQRSTHPDLEDLRAELVFKRLQMDETGFGSWTMSK